MINPVFQLIGTGIFLTVSPEAGLIALGVGIATSIISHFFRPPDKENQTLTHIQALHDAQKAQKDAEAAVKKAQQFAQQVKQRADLDREQARARQAEADRAATRAVAEAKRVKKQVKKQMKEAARAAKHAEALAAEARIAAKEEAEKLAREAKEERERAQKIRDDAQRVAAAAKDKADRAQEAAETQCREAEAGKALAEEIARTAVEEALKAKEAKEEAERQLKEGIQPVVTPSPKEVAAAKRRIQYREDCFHFAAAGISGSGKSSLVNAFRGLHSQDAGAAAVGVKETTLVMTRYADANPYVWYDIPGAGTLKCHDWQYFNDQGLYVFDCIIILFDNRFTMTDIAILLNARRFNIPTYIVRSKADQHIRNVMTDMGYDSEGDDEDARRRNELYKAARERFIEETRETVRVNLIDANLPDQRVYIVSSTALLSIVQGRMPKKTTIDEVELLNDLFTEAHSRRANEAPAN